MEHFGPCKDKNCGHCCEPVKVNVKAQGELPRDKNGNEIWSERSEILIPENEIETTRLKTFDCKNYDAINKVCLDYENRPEICRDSTCIKDENGDIDEQHKKELDQKFIKIYPRMR